VAIDIEYDDAGNPKTVTRSRGASSDVASFTYDSEARLDTATTDARAEDYVYAASGDLESVLDPNSGAALETRSFDRSSYLGTASPLLSQAVGYDARGKVYVVKFSLVYCIIFD
jgi:uncharacterized protein RhaS with RHS repeats